MLHQGLPPLGAIWAHAPQSAASRQTRPVANVGRSQVLNQVIKKGMHVAGVCVLHAHQLFNSHHQLAC